MTPLLVKGRDCWWTVFVVDPIAGPLVGLLRNVRAATPNRLTALSVVLAGFAAAAFARGDLVAGGLLFQASFVVDCMDGKLATASRSRDPHGGYVDAIGDTVRFVACTAALAPSVAGAAGPRVEVALVALFPALHYGLLAVERAWPGPRPAATVAVLPSPAAFLRAAPARASRPGTTVDTEALAFTLGPLLGLPLLGVGAAVGLDLLRLVTTVALRLSRANPASAGREVAVEQLERLFDRA